MAAVATATATASDLARLAEQETRLAALATAGVPADVVDEVRAELDALEPLRAVAAFEPCQGHACGLYVDNDARDKQGFLTCSQACAESIAEAQWEADEERRAQAVLA